MINQLLEHQDQIYKAILETLLLVGVSSTIALMSGLLLGIGIYTSKPDGIKPSRLLNTVTNAYVNIVRSFPFLIFIVMLFPFTRFVLGRSIGTLPATLPLTLVSIAIFARFVEQSLLEVPQTIIDTGYSMGASSYQLLRYFILPSARQGIILGFTSTIISTLSYSTVVGVVGGGGIGDFAFRHGYQSFNYTLMYAIVFIIVVIVQMIQYLGNKLAKPQY